MGSLQSLRGFGVGCLLHEQQPHVAGAEAVGLAAEFAADFSLAVTTGVHGSHGLFLAQGAKDLGNALARAGAAEMQLTLAEDEYDFMAEMI